MGFSQLSLKDKEIVLMALKAAVSRQYIDEDDIELVFGVKRDVFDALIEKYPNFSDSERAEDSETVHAIDISLVFFQGMASIKTYQKMFTVPQSELRRVHSVWSENRGIQPIYGD